MFNATKFVAAGAIVALAGGFLLTGVLTTQPASEDPPIGAAVSPSAEPSPRKGGSSTPPPCPPVWDPPDRSILWETSSASLQADAIDMRFGDCYFSGVGPAELNSDPGDPEYRTLEVNWEEQGAATRFYVYFGADETHWWVSELSTPAGRFLEDPSATYKNSQLFKTPRGETFEGDVHLKPVPDSEVTDQPRDLTITGLRLTAFAPGTGPAPLTDCKHVPQPKRAETRRRLVKAGIKKMTPVEAETLLCDRGLCFTFRYGYPLPPSPDDPDEGSVGGGERWCTAPPSGRVADLTYLPDGEVVVFVEDKEVRPMRTQPPEGWNCQAQ